MSSPSNRKTAPSTPPHSATARRAITSKTGCTSVGEAEILEDLGGRRLPRERISELMFRASSSVKRRTFSMAMTAWSAKVWSRAICVSENRPGRRAPDDAPDRTAVAQHRNGDRTPRTRVRNDPRHDVRFGRIVRGLHDAAVADRARDEASIAHGHREVAPDHLELLGRPLMRGHEVDQFTVEPEHATEAGGAQTHAALHDRLEHGMRSSRGP